MAVVRFDNATVKRACCDESAMPKAWGPTTVRAISRRLQQLEAMTSIEDLGFLPFDAQRRGDGQFEVAVTEQVALVADWRADKEREGITMDTIVITAVLEVAPRAGRSR